MSKNNIATSTCCESNTGLEGSLPLDQSMIFVQHCATSTLFSVVGNNSFSPIRCDTSIDAAFDDQIDHYMTDILDFHGVDANVIPKGIRREVVQEKEQHQPIRLRGKVGLGRLHEEVLLLK
jgi:hypothetical protein